MPLKDSMHTISAANYSHHFHHNIFGSKPEDKQVPLYEIDDYTPEVATQKKYKLQQKYALENTMLFI